MKFIDAAEVMNSVIMVILFLFPCLFVFTEVLQTASKKRM